MFGNIENMLTEKVKSEQQKLRERDERILALETENAMLYLKLAQCQGNLRAIKEEASFCRMVNSEDEKSRVEIKTRLCSAHEQVKSLQAESAFMKREMNALMEKFKSTMFSGQDGERGLSSLLDNLKMSQNVDTAALQTKLLQVELERDELERRSNVERLRRRTLHNTLVELRGNIRVHCRIRPLLAKLDSHGEDAADTTQLKNVVYAVDEENVLFHQTNYSNSCQNKSKPFEYERVYKPSDDQDIVFNDVAPLLTSLLDGYNVCIMAYGQTGSGKTHTMLGDHSIYGDVSLDELTQDRKHGIIPRSAKEIIKLMKERESATEKFSLELCVFEVYNNEIIDLLMAQPHQHGVKHAVFSASDGSQEIPSLSTKKVTCVKEVMDYVTLGMMHRHEDSTQVHSHSSRSHLIVQLNIYQTTVTTMTTTEDRNDMTGKNFRSKSPTSRYSKSPVSAKKTMRVVTPRRAHDDTRSCMRALSSTHPHVEVVKTKLQLVDLAGSECVAMSGVTGSALRETSNINKSLSALADVLQALSENQNHIPYRNTKLTHILQDTIGGDSKLLVMLCVSPAQKYTTETLQCLGFGSRTRQVSRGPAKKRRSNIQNADSAIIGRPASSLLMRSSSTKR